MALTDRQEEIISEVLQPLFQYLEKEVIADVAKRIKNSLAYTRTAELKAESMQKLGYSPAKIRKEAMKLLNSDAEFRKMVAKNTLEYKKTVKKLLKDIEKEALKQKDEVLTDTADMSYFDDLRIWKEGGRELTDSSFLPQLVEAMQKQTTATLKNLTGTTGFKTMSGFEAMEDLYRRELDKAMIKVCTGTYTREQVVYEVVHDLASSGLRSIDFSSGYTMQLDTAVKLAMRTGAHQVSGKITDENILRSGENLVYISKHWGARNTGVGHANHEQWQGKVYFVKEGYDYREEAKRIGQDRITDLWYATGYSLDGSHENDPLGLDGYNCRHRKYPWFLGISELPDDDPEPAPVIINGKEYDYYKMTQKMRSMEREIRALKREREAMQSLGMDTKEVQKKISSRIKEYNDFCKDCKVQPQINRLRYEAGTSDLKKTEAWKKFHEIITRKNIDFGKIKNVRFEKTSSKTIVSAEDVSKIQMTISELGKEYQIHLDYFEVGDYNDNEHVSSPMFFKAIDDNGIYKSKLVINNACEFWNDKAYREFVLGSGYFAGDSVEDFVRHEMAHVITFQSCRTIEDYLRLEKEIHPLYTNGVSRYNWQSKDGAETIAEAFVRNKKGKTVNIDALFLLQKYVEVWKID